MSKKTWADVRKGDVVELGGQIFDVVKVKPKGKKARVVVARKGREFDSVVKLSEKVTIAKKGDGTKRGPLYDERGQARRWATKKEAREAGVAATLPKGDPEQTKPPRKPGPDLWETPANRIERKLDELLSARLIAETPNEDAGYYVPPIDVSTVAAHLALFHGGIPPACEDEGAMLKAHESQHAEAVRGLPLAVNHWHTATRPKDG